MKTVESVTKEEKVNLHSKAEMNILGDPCSASLPFGWCKLEVTRIGGSRRNHLNLWYSWFLSFLPQWFMIPTRLFFQIHDLRRLLMIYSVNEFLRGHFVSFCIVFLECSSFYFHPELYRFLDHCFSVSSSFILLLNTKHQCHWRNKRTISPECTKNRGHAPPEKKKL